MKTDNQNNEKGACADSSPSACSPSADATNLAYIVIFLRNGGERLRAIWLAKSTLEIGIREAMEWVDTVKLIKGPMPELLPEYPPQERTAPMVVSHWPPTVEAIIKANVEAQGRLPDTEAENETVGRTQP